MTKEQNNKIVDNIRANQNDNIDFKPARSNRCLWNSALIGRNFNIVRVIYWVMTAVLAVLAVYGVILGKRIGVHGDNSTAVDFMKGLGYMYTGTLAPIIYGVVAVLVPIFMLTNEIDNTSLAISLVSNNSRRKVLVNKMISIFFMWLIIYALTTLFGGASSAALAPKGSAAMFINSNTELWMGSLLLAMITFLIASLWTNKGTVHAIAWIILAISYIVPIVGQFVFGTTLDGHASTGEQVCQYFSVYAFFQLNYVLDSSALVAIGYCVGPVLIIGLGVASVYAFQGRSLQL